MLRTLSLMPLVSLLLLMGCDDGRRPTGPGGSDAGAPADAGPPACAPQCSGLDCGDDGCGGTCGTCSAGTECTAGICEASLCPPAEPFGVHMMNTAPDVVLTDCEGVEYRLHDLCQHEASWIMELALWCPPCLRLAAEANRIYERFAAEDFEAYVILTENGDSAPPTADDCRAVRDDPRWGLTMPVLYDPEGRFPRALEVPVNAYNLIMTEGNVIYWEGRYAEEFVEPKLEEVFGARP